MSTADKPGFAINDGAETVAATIGGFVENACKAFADDTHVSIATAYFNVGGYSLIADALDHAAGVRLLLGAEPDQADRRLRKLKSESVSPARAAHARINRALEGHSRSLTEARDLLGFDVDSDASAKRLLGWLASGKVEVRRVTDRFLHGKAFIIGDHSHGAIAGSSNFTYAGLAKNVELNLGNYDGVTVTAVQSWFDELWDTADDFDLAAIYRARYDEHAPQLIYLRMLYERYGDELATEATESGMPHIHLTSFQKDGLWRARRILDELSGVLIADEVGLGKTFLAGELIREATIDRRQRVLVIAPATLRDGPWRNFISEQNLPAEVISFDDLTGDKRLNPEHATGTTLAAKHINDYAMVIVDEAHNLRTPTTQRAESLRRLLAGSPPKALVLLTATPVNNSLWDLYYLLAYFLRNDATFADIGIKSMRDHFATAMALNPDDLTPEHLFDILDATAVRRTRSFVKRFYPNDTVKIGGVEKHIVFPTPRVRKVSYDLDAVLPGFFDQFEHALDSDENTDPVDDPGVLTLARYAPSRYRCDGDRDAYEVQLAGLLRSGMLKRFESSPYAFACTCEKMADSHDTFLQLLDLGKVASGSALTDWISTDSDEEDAVDTYMDTHVDLLDDASDFDTEALRAHAEHDRDLLRAFAAKARTVTREADPNLAALIEELAQIAGEAAAEGVTDEEIRDKRKLLIFSYFADTVDWITEYLIEATHADPRLAAYKGRVTALSGHGGASAKEDVLYGFAPKTTDAPDGSDEDKYDIVVTTDVLAEGVNLQQARHIINYDLPWNPMRLVQRHGRIDRIGSFHSEVFLRCVFPDDRLDDLLGLQERLNTKLAQAAAAVGVGNVLPGQTSVDIEFAETRDEIERLRAENPELFERGGTTRGVLSGEEYRQELRAALENDQLAEQIRALPWGSGSGMAATRHDGIDRTGYVFCARVGDWDRPLYRYIEPGPGEPLILDDTLACLDSARPADVFDTPRVLDDVTYTGSFDAWSMALSDIVERWNWHADKANLEPDVPKAMARAVEIVREHAPTGMAQDDIDRAVDTLAAPYPERILRTFRVALRSSSDPTEQAERVLKVIAELGLQPYEPPEPLPQITPEDVHLVCWLALVPPK